jgi:2-amino-4-hydroxy-6-hydroxymethyldihydropteridine diphosphokinase
MSDRQQWMPAYIGIGSNLDDPVQQVRTAIALLGGLPVSRLVATSPLYSNPPMGPRDQPDYVNAVAGLLTMQEPEALLLQLQALENRLGRVRQAGDRWGPRIIDLDLLVYGGLQRSVPGLNLPHPGIFERNFVLFPLSDIAPALHVPGQGIVAAMAARLDKTGLRRVEI